MPTDILFVHNNFPGQFGFIARAMKERGARCAAIASHTGKGVEGVPMLKWGLKRGTAKDIFPDAVRAEADLMRGRGAAQCALELKKQGLDPQVIVGHPGWGEMIYMREIFPNARQIQYGEYYYRSRGGDVGFDPEFPQPSIDDDLKVHPKNATQILQYSEADVIVSPTPFQASRFPSILKPRMRIIHEGVDVEAIKPNPEAAFTLADGRRLTRADNVVTFINRRFEPMRGYHIFMRALPAIQAALPDVQTLLIGADETGGYGRPPPKGTTWGQHYLNEVKDRLDMSRVHFTGTLPHDQMLAALSISSAHIYYTYPFVLSWSLLEAMASECPIIASDTAPVRDALHDGRTARMLDFFDVDALAQTTIEAIRKPQSMLPLRKAARQEAMRHWDRKRLCEPAWLGLMQEMIGGRSHAAGAVPAAHAPKPPGGRPPRRRR